ncbi:unnamed protein product [Candidula unifasciata]|uniref:Uncharacterized protein n=1 Tax=Candidula unifasciata TaxID=100452 RepID=A0A8S3ZY90_9EUPU|nr:unnamed protein product [Candidula unifasciata]
MASNFTDKVAIVTGSSSGIGEAIALAFASRGAKVTLCGRDSQRLDAVCSQAVEISGGQRDRFLTFEGDLNDSGVRRRIIEKTVDKFGRLDILVASAGISDTQMSILNATEESYDAVMNTNLKSIFFLIQQAIPHLEKSKGNIVTISSNVSSMVLPITAVYSMSKVALDHLTRCLAVELGQKGIRIELLKEMGKLDANKVPLKDRVLTAEDVAETVVFLSCETAKFITGETVKIDGGRSLTGPLDISDYVDLL